MRTLVVDGYNAIYAIPEIRAELKVSLLSARTEVLALCREYARSSGFIDDVRVVFDGRKKYRYLDKSDPTRCKTQVFSVEGKGDDKVIETVRVCSRKGKVVVASNDNYVRNNSRAYGASLIDVTELTSRKSTAGRGAESGIKKINKELMDEITEEYRKELGL